MTLVTLAFVLPYPLECGQPCEYDGVPLLDLWQKRLADIISPKLSDLRKWSYIGGPGLITRGLLNLGPRARRGRSQRFKAWEGIDPPLLDWRWRSHMVRCRWHLGAESGPWLIGNQATVTSVLQGKGLNCSNEKSELGREVFLRIQMRTLADTGISALWYSEQGT